MRPRVLLCWGYHREGWIRPFEALRDDLDLHYLFYRNRDEEEEPRTDAPRHYWFDYRSAASVLDAVRPDRVVFMALDGAWAIALNVAAKRRGVPTFIVQHGHLELGNDQPKIGLRDAIGGGSQSRTLSFLIRSLIGSPRELVDSLRFLYAVRRFGPGTAALRYSFAARLPNYYVMFSPESTLARQKIDGADPSRMICIGVPEYDEIFLRVSPGSPATGSLLLLDSPNAENRWDAITTTKGEKARFLAALDASAARMALPLRVKLHPETYGAAWLPELPNTTYIEDGDVAAELNASAICVGFDSMLIVPAVWLRPTILIRLRPSRVVDIARNLDSALVVDGLDEVDERLLREATPSLGGRLDERHRFVRRFALETDGHASRRLREVLTDFRSVLAAQR
jgi:hypothetical protein